MANESYKVSDNILFFLKKNGSAGTTNIAQAFSVTTMAVRQHLHIHMQNELVRFEDIPAVRGRPKRIWMLTSKAEQQFPNDSEHFLKFCLDDLPTEIFSELTFQMYSAYEKLINLDAFKTIFTLDELRSQIDKHISASGYLYEIQQDTSMLNWHIFHCPHWAMIRNQPKLADHEYGLFEKMLTNYKVEMLGFEFEEKFSVSFDIFTK